MNDEYGFTPPESFTPAEWEEATAPPGEEQHVPTVRQDDEPEPETDPATDHTMIQVRTPEYVAMLGHNISTGNVLVSYRKRKLPEEGGLEFVKGEPTYPIPLEMPKE